MSCPSPTRATSGGVSVIVVEQATQYTRPTDVPKWAIGFSRCSVTSMAQRHVALSLVGPRRVVVTRVALHDVVQMPQAETEEVIQALAFQVRDPGFGEAIGTGCAVRSLCD